MIWLDRTGYPLVRIKHRPVVNMIRWLLHVSLWNSFRMRGRWQRVQRGGLTDTWCRFDRDAPAAKREDAK